MTVVSIAAAGNTDRAFSADTGMAEVLLIATRARESPVGTERDALFVNLFRRPAEVAEGSVLGDLVHRLPESSSTGWMHLGDECVGSYVRAPLTEGGCAGVRDPFLAEVMLRLMRRGELLLPRTRTRLRLPVARLECLGERGLLHRDINGMASDGPRGPFDIVQPGPAPEYPVLWAHDDDRERAIIVLRDKEARVRSGM